MLIAKPSETIQFYSRAAQCFCAMAGIFLIFFSGETFGTRSVQIGMITADHLNVRPEPGLNKPPVKTLSGGARIEILEYLNGWVKISHKGLTGFIRNRKQYFRLVHDGEPRATESIESVEDIDRIKKKAEDISRKIQQSEQEVVSFTRKETAFISRLNEIDLALNRAANHISNLKTELSRIDAAVEQTTRASLDLQKRIRATETYASKRLAALYKLNQLGILHVLASAESLYDLFHRKTALERILTHDEQTWKTLSDDRARLTQMLIELNTTKEQKLSLEATIEQQIRKMSEERSGRKQMLADIRNKKSLELAAIAALKQAADELDDTIQSLTESPPPDASDAGTRFKKERPDSVYRELSLKPFNELKGLLNMPVNGRIISHFGRFKNTKFNIVNFRSGIDIETDRGEPIHAVCGGRVLYASWFKGYGNMLVIDHGLNFCTVYAHAEELFKAKGDLVEAGEVIATVGDSGSMVGPSLYFELRHHGKPLNPIKWMKKG